MNYRDCNYTIKIIGKDSVIDCYTKEQLLNNIKHPKGCIVYAMNHNTRKAELLTAIKPYEELTNDD